jgi:anion transporter
MSQYHLNRLPKKESSKFEQIMVKIGAPLAIISFILLNFFIDIPFLQNIDPSILSKKAKLLYDSVGADVFSAKNVSMLAVFTGAIILWITETIPNYLTSLILIISLVLTGVISEVDAYHQLGHKIMWLNILSFILASMLVKTGAAKRFALWFIVKFGKSASSVFVSFIAINLILSAFISATTAKAAILLPIFMVVAAVYGARGGKNRNNFGRNIVLQNLFQINIAAGAFVTGSGANLLAAALIGGAIGSDIFFTDWMIVALPISVAMMIIGWFVGTKFIFPMKPEERVPQIEGGMDRLKEELKKMGKIKFEEVKAGIIFIAVLLLWVTARWHGVSATAIAFLGAVVALLPRIGVVKWNDVDIPWHLLLFSAGAYTLGAGFKATDLPAISVNALFDGLGFGAGTPFWVLYLILTGGMLFSAIFFQSKTMRTLIFIPIAIGVAQKFGYPVMSLAFPVALLIEHVYVLPFNSKPAALLYVTDQYSWSDTFKFGITMMIIAWGISILMGMTFFKFMGITPNGLF